MSEACGDEEFDNKWIQEKLEREDRERKKREELAKLGKWYWIFLITFILVGYFFIKSKGGF